MVLAHRGDHPGLPGDPPRHGHVGRRGVHHAERLHERHPEGRAPRGVPLHGRQGVLRRVPVGHVPEQGQLVRQDQAHQRLHGPSGQTAEQQGTRQCGQAGQAAHPPENVPVGWGCR